MAKKDNQRKIVRDAIAAFVKKRAVKAALSWVAKKAVWATTGPLGWITSIVVGLLWDHFGDKVVRWAIRNSVLVYDKIDGSIKAKKIKQARGSNDSSYDDAVDDIFD